MPYKYMRKTSVIQLHISWTGTSLALALEELDIKVKGVSEVCRFCAIPFCALRRQQGKNNIY